MTQTNVTCRGGRPSGARRPGAGRIATHRTRVRVSSDAVVSAYIHDIASPPAEERQDPHPAVLLKMTAGTRNRPTRLTVASRGDRDGFRSGGEHRHALPLILG